MPNTQYYDPYSAADWSREISPPAGAYQPGAHASASTSTTTTTTSTASAGGPAAAAAPSTTTTTTQHSTAAAPAAQAPAGPAAPAAQAPAAVPAAQQPLSYPAPAGRPQSAVPAAPRSEFHGSSGTLGLETHQPIEVIEAPASMSEAFLGSLKSMLLRNKGAFVTATFLIGTQGTTTWEGLLHDVGNDYIIIFQPGRQRYIASDIYSLKYIEFYDTKQRQICEQLLRENGLDTF